MTRLGKISACGYFLHGHGQFSPKLAVLKHGFVVLILTFKSSLMQLFWNFDLSFDILVTVLDTLHKIGQLFQSSGHSGQALKTRRNKTGLNVKAGLNVIKLFCPYFFKFS